MERNVLLTLLLNNSKKATKQNKSKTSKKLNTELLLNPLRLNFKNDILTSAKKVAPQISMGEALNIVATYLKKHKLDIAEFAHLHADYYNSYNDIEHCQRVLLYTAYITIMEKLPLNCFKILVNAAKLHDIGRNSDKNDLLHGHKGAATIKNYNLTNFQGKDLNMLLAAVDSHSAYDKNIEGVMFKYEIDLKDYPLVKKMCNILKDAEALDKVRFLDDKSINIEKLVKVNMLKTKAAKQLVTLTFDLFEYYKEN